MTIVGRRFWTWVSVWVLSIFWKGEFSAHPATDPLDQQDVTIQHKQHNVPALVPGVGKFHAAVTQKGREHKINTNIDKSNSRSTEVVNEKRSSTKVPHKVMLDAGSKDAAKVRKSITLKQK